MVPCEKVRSPTRHSITTSSLSACGSLLSKRRDHTARISGSCPLTGTRRSPLTFTYDDGLIYLELHTHRLFRSLLFSAGLIISRASAHKVQQACGIFFTAYFILRGIHQTCLRGDYLYGIASSTGDLCEESRTIYCGNICVHLEERENMRP